MRDYVRIVNGTFQADILLAQLENFRITKLRKLFKLADGERWANEAAIDTIRQYLDEVIPEAQAAMKSAALAYENGWRQVDKPRSRLPEVVQQRKKNQELTNAFRTAKAHYERLVQVRKAFDETLASDTKH